MLVPPGPPPNACNATTLLRRRSAESCALLATAPLGPGPPTLKVLAPDALDTRREMDTEEASLTRWLRGKLRWGLAGGVGGGDVLV
jgi:hypothetical protein